MKSEAVDIQQRMENFQAGLARAGVKATHQRLEIFREVVGSGDHPDAESIFMGVRKRMPTVSLDTVYRTLWLLLDLGLITTLGPPREKTRFDANQRPHHHFICTRCGLARDFYSEELDRLRIPEAVKTWGQVDAIQVEVRGICADCAEEPKQTPRVRREKEE